MAPTLRDAIHVPFLVHFYVQKFPCPSKTIEACCRTIRSVRKYEVCVTYACNSVVKHLKFGVFQFRPAYLPDETPDILKNKVRQPQLLSPLRTELKELRSQNCRTPRTSRGVFTVFDLNILSFNHQFTKSEDIIAWLQTMNIDPEVKCVFLCYV
ncbi:uncharacterized protein LOC111347332 [Stylophora pistillata]|uniref:uncharacterized protein LOC111347332 n=1 Tax=Stylophora pistillata TaxID=50429 RepID=UPI000C052DA6|nr:uncharacterized protein LOC111347332 [Stylophora pistillata]